MSKLKLTYDPKLSIVGNAERAVVTVDAVKKYMTKNDIDGRKNNYFSRCLTLRKAIDKLEKQGIKPTIAKLHIATGYSPKTIQKYLRVIEGKTCSEILHQNPIKSSDIIKSASNNQIEILQDILRLHSYNKQIDADFTISDKEGFYKNGKIPRPHYCFDKFSHCQERGILPLEEVEKLPNNSLYTIIIDPPFTISSGPSIHNDTGKSTIEGSNLTSDRFGSFTSTAKLEEAYTYLLEQARRVLVTKKGIVIFKLQPTVTSGRLYLSNVFTINKAIELGFECIDEFVLLARTKVLSPKHSPFNQQHARRYHSYFYVFRKK